MKKHALTAEKREQFGRKVKHLRSSGNIPATIYGKGIKSLSVTVRGDMFEKVYGQAGETGLVELSVGESIHPVLIHTIQRDPVHHQLLHIEFHHVDLKQKVRAKIPLELMGDAPAVVGKVGVLLTLLNTIDVEALPTNLPDKIAVDVTKLTSVDEDVKVGALLLPSGVTLLTNKDVTIVRVGALISKEAEAEAAAEAAAAAAAAAEAAAAQTPGAPAEATPATSEEKPSEPKKSPPENKV